MALYLAGFRGVPEELREAARMDGASEWRVYRHVVFPYLRPVTLSALIILGHISIKVFDLIVAIGGKQLITQTPAVYMWILIYDARDYAKGAAIATLLLIGISVLIIPYLVYTVRSERQRVTGVDAPSPVERRSRSAGAARRRRRSAVKYVAARVFVVIISDAGLRAPRRRASRASRRPIRAMRGPCPNIWTLDAWRAGVERSSRRAARQQLQARASRRR